MKEDKVVGKCKFLDWNCIVVESRYFGDRIALQLFDESDGDCIAVATVNLPEEDDDNSKYVFIKDYSENKGIFACLMDAGIISESKEKIDRGHVSIWKTLYLK